MKKIITTALIVAMLTASLAGCSGNTDSGNSSTVSTDSGTSSANSGTSSADSGTSSDTADSGSTSGETSGDNTSNDSATGESSSDSEEESYPSAAESLEFPDNKAGRMVKAALAVNADDWSMGMQIDDGNMLPVSFPDLTVDMFEEYCFAFDMIGINGHTAFAGKAKAGQEDAVKTAIEKGLEAYKESVSFYPAGQESAAGAASGTTDDGYHYFVIHANGQDAASAMADAN